MIAPYKIGALAVAVTVFTSIVARGEGFSVPDPRLSGNFQIRSMIWSPDSTGYTGYDRAITVGRVWSGTQFLGMIGAFRASDGGHDVNFGLAGGGGYKGDFAGGNRARRVLPHGTRVLEFTNANSAGNGYDNLCTSVIEVDTTNHYYVAGCRAMKNNTYYDSYLVKFDKFGNLITSFGSNGIKAIGADLGATITNHTFIRGLAPASGTDFVAVAAVGNYNVVPSSNTFEPFAARFNVNGVVQDVSSNSAICTGKGTGYANIGVGMTPTGVVFDSTSSAFITPIVDVFPATNGRRRSFHQVYDLGNMDIKCSMVAATSHPFFSTSTTEWATYNDTVLVGVDTFVESGTTVSYYAGAARVNAGASAGAYSCLLAYASEDGEVPAISGTWGRFLVRSIQNSAFDGEGATIFNPQTDFMKRTKDCFLNDVKVREIGAGDVRQYVAGAVYSGSNYDFLSGVIGDQGNSIRSLTYGPEGAENDVSNKVQFFSTAGSTATHENFYTVGRASTSLSTTATQFAQAHLNKVTNREEWVATSGTSAPAARQGHSAVWNGSKMLVWGGAAAGGIYDPVSDSWIAMETTNAPTVYSNTQAFWTGTDMFVWDGNPGGTPQGKSLRTTSTDANGEWTTLATANQPSSRSDFAMAGANTGTGSYIVVWGGVDGSTYRNSGSYFKVTSSSWSALPASGMSARSRLSGVAFTSTGGDAMMFWGGYNGVSALDDGQILNLSTWGDQFTSGTATYGHKMSYDFARRILRFGGTNGTTYQTGHYMDIYPTMSTFEWSAMSGTGSPGGRTEHVQVWNGSKLLVWGGFNGAVMAAGGLYEPYTNTWSTVATTTYALDPKTYWDGTTASTAPSARRNASVVWSGERAIVWGGNDGSNTNTGGQYSPAATIARVDRDVWTATTTTSAPTARMAATSVWTGKHMIVWGGRDVAGNGVAGGGRYDPVANSWAAVDTADGDAPATRVGHTAVWTGSEMIIWGGASTYQGATEYANGGRYYPAEPGGGNTWLPVSATLQPPKRWGHSAVWAATNTSMLHEMVIYGGFNDGVLSGTDAYRYNPTTNTWGAILSLGEVEARTRAGMWFDGQNIGIWGGRNTTVPLADGVMYDITTGTNTVVSASAAPTARVPNLIWTGKHVVVMDVGFGEEAACGSLLDSQRGARFDPFTGTGGTWSAVSTVGMPTDCRAGAGFTWTGSKIFYYGGLDDSISARNTGGLYDPVFNVWTSLTHSLYPGSGAATVWNGNEVILWGGGNYSSVYNTGTLYQR